MDTLNALKNIVGEAYFVGPDGDQDNFINERRDLFHQSASAVVSPADVGQVQEIVRFANAHGIALIPQGGNTGLVGGQVPKSGKEIILSVARLNQMEPVNHAAKSMQLGAGVILQNARAHAVKADLLYPLFIASQGSCMVGGNLASNAGGTNVLAYGNARALCLGVQAVLPDGSLYDNLAGLRKDNTGYNLDQLLVGSEGTLGVITAATLKLFPKPIGYESAWLAIDEPKDGTALLNLLQSAVGSRLTSLEIMPEMAFEFLLSSGEMEKHPFASPTKWYILAELSCFNQSEFGMLADFLGQAAEQGIVQDGIVSRSVKDRAAFWNYREKFSAVQSKIGGSIKNDVAVPIEATAELLIRGIESVTAYMPDIRPVPFGHFGDGNIHFNFTAPVGMGREEFLTHWDEVCGRINEVVFSLGGSFSAEHGIGQLKTATLAKAKDPAAYAAMRAIKTALDPNNIMNPGKMFAD